MVDVPSDCDQVHLLLQHQLRQKIIRLRHERQWSFEELAARTGFSPQLLEAMENGDYDISPSDAVRLLDAYENGEFSFYQN